VLNPSIRPLHGLLRAKGLPASLAGATKAVRAEPVEAGAVFVISTAVFRVSRLPGDQLGAHALVVRAAPVDSSTRGAMAERFIRPERIGRRARQCCGICCNQRRVVLQAAGKGMCQPVEPEVRAERGGEPVEIALRQQQRHAARRLVFLHQLILREDVAPFPTVLPQRLSLAAAAVGQQRVISGGAQVAAQPAEHFVAQKAGYRIHARIVRLTVKIGDTGHCLQSGVWLESTRGNLLTLQGERQWNTLYPHCPTRWTRCSRTCRRKPSNTITASTIRPTSPISTT